MSADKCNCDFLPSGGMEWNPKCPLHGKRGTHSQQRRVKPRRRWTKPKEMWAYFAITDDGIHCYPSQRKVREMFAEQGKSKRVRKVRVQWLKSLETTMGYLHAESFSVRSPLDAAELRSPAEIDFGGLLK